MSRFNFNRRALEIAGGFLLLSALWILFSDYLLLRLLDQPAMTGELSVYQSYKGLFFVALTAGLIYLLTATSLNTQKEALEKLTRAEERYRHLVVDLPVGIYQTDSRGNRIFCNTTAAELTGHNPEHSPGADWLTSVHEGDRERIRAAWQRTLADSLIFYEEYRLAVPGRLILWVIDMAHPQFDGSGSLTGYFGTLTDITAMHAAKESEERRRLYAAAFDNINEGVIITNQDQFIVSVNNAAQRIFGYEEHELLGHKPSILNSDTHDEAYFQSMQLALEQTGIWQGEIWNRTGQGEVSPQWLSISTLYDQDDRPDKYVAIYKDLSQRKQNEAYVERLSHYDALTGLPNRLLLTSRLDHGVKQAARQEYALAVLIMDLDDFKTINDSMGHAIGDELLQAVAARLSARIRAEDTLGRLAADEFLLFIEDLKDHSAAGVLAVDMLSTLRDPFVLSNGSEIYLEACIGLAIYPDNGKSPESLLRSADTALHHAKQLGRNRFRFYTREMGIAAVEQLELETALRQALERNELLLHFQPKVDLRTGRINGAEALVRWQRPGVGLVSPGKFISVAEKTGLIKPLGDWVINETCREIRRWLDLGLEPINVSVNVSVHQFQGNDLHEVVARCLARHDLDARHLGLEITESVLMERPEEVNSILRSLKEAGLRIALDDFGTGYSNMSYLAKFSLDVLKIDASFIEDLGVDDHASKLVKSVIDLAHNIGLLTVAEGVETNEQLEYLRARGCDEMQGFYFSRAVTGDEFVDYLKQGKSLPL